MFICTGEHVYERSVLPRGIRLMAMTCSGTVPPLMDVETIAPTPASLVGVKSGSGCSRFKSAV